MGKNILIGTVMAGTYCKTTTQRVEERRLPTADPAEVDLLQLSRI